MRFCAHWDACLFFSSFLHPVIFAVVHFYFFMFILMKFLIYYIIFLKFFYSFDWKFFNWCCNFYLFFPLLFFLFNARSSIDLKQVIHLSANLASPWGWGPRRPMRLWAARHSPAGSLGRLPPAQDRKVRKLKRSVSCVGCTIGNWGGIQRWN